MIQLQENAQTDERPEGRQALFHRTFWATTGGSTRSVSTTERLNLQEPSFAPFDTSWETRLYVDSSFAGTQETVAQQYKTNQKDHWIPVNHAPQARTTPTTNYTQMEKESNDILPGLDINKIYTHSTHVKVVIDHQPQHKAKTLKNGPSSTQITFVLPPCCA